MLVGSPLFKYSSIVSSKNLSAVIIDFSRLRLNQATTYDIKIIMWMNICHLFTTHKKPDSPPNGTALLCPALLTISVLLGISFV